eukprot:m.121572 g.121572  ORF g.121572 m.121572 type:complete len:138 (+) comp28864_c0_seq2:235-648(+)
MFIYTSVLVSWELVSRSVDKIANLWDATKTSQIESTNSTTSVTPSATISGGTAANATDGQAFPTVTPSLIPQCTEIKHTYDECFNKWYRDSFIKGITTNPDPCTDIFKEYQDCFKMHSGSLKLNLEDTYIQIPTNST